MKPSDIGDIYKKQKGSVFIEIPEAELMGTLKKIKENGITRICDISGYDNGKEIEVMYRFPIEKDKILINIKVRIARNKPRIKTVTRIFPGAFLYERELSEMFGIDIANHPDLRKLLLHRNSPDAPLKKEVEIRKNGKRS